jgi:putative transposase
MQRAHKIRLNPTPEQASYFRKACGIARFTYNYGLHTIKDALNEQHKPDSVSAIKTQFNAIKAELYPWIYEVTKCAAETGFRNLQTALTNFWKSKKGERKGKSSGMVARFSEWTDFIPPARYITSAATATEI